MNKGSETYAVLEEISLSLLAEGKTVKARAEGFSMFPFIKPGAIIMFSPVTPETILVPGEIIVLKRDPGLVLHRLVSIRKNNNKVLFITRGDSCVEEDKPVSREQIAARVVRIEDSMGSIREGDTLIRKPCYFYNRIRIRIFFRLRRISDLWHRIIR